MHSKEKKVEIGRITTTTTTKPKVYIFYFEKKSKNIIKMVGIIFLFTKGEKGMKILIYS